jgi:hypothetical protein
MAVDMRYKPDQVLLKGCVIWREPTQKVEVESEIDKLAHSYKDEAALIACSEGAQSFCLLAGIDIGASLLVS